MKPLAGVRVLDFTHALAGPFCTYQLGLLGADIVKIEPPGPGDDFRDFSPQLFTAVNGGKKSVTLDLKKPESRPVMDRLLAEADVVVENFRPGMAQKFGLDWDRISAINPKLIYCQISGFGQGGPLQFTPAVEWSVQGASGLTAQYMDDDADPRDMGLGVLDVSTGASSVTAILAALLQRANTGRGQRIDAAMIDTAFMLSSGRLGLPQVPGQGKRVRRPAVGRFRAQDRRIFMMGAHQRWFTTISEVLGEPLLVADPRFATPQAREENADALREAIEARLAAKPAAEWEAALTARGVPAAIIRTLEEIAAHPHVQQRKNLKTTRREDGTEVVVMGAPYQFAVDGPDAPGDVPTLGRDTDAVLKSYGFSEAELAELRQAGVI